MQAIFGTGPIALLDGVLIVGVGVVLLILVEIEKRITGRLFAARPSTQAAALAVSA
jgi:hypothetical protein